MPKRTNLFQEVVEIIHRHMAAEATVEASAMLVYRVTGYEREVDVVIRSRSAGYEIIVSVEAVGGSRAASVEWVEQMVAKHKNLPSTKLVLVSENGFSAQARSLAHSEGAVALAPEDLTGAEPGGRVIDAIPSLWPRVVTVRPQQFSVKFDDEDAPRGGWPCEQPAVYLDDSSQLAGSLQEFFQTMYQKRMRELMDRIGLAAITSDDVRPFALKLENLRLQVDGAERYVCLLNEDGRLYSLKWILAVGECAIQVSQIPLQHGRLGEMDVLFSYGEGKVAGRDALVVLSTSATEEHGNITFRIRPGV